MLALHKNEKHAIDFKKRKILTIDNNYHKFATKDTHLSYDH